MVTFSCAFHPSHADGRLNCETDLVRVSRTRIRTNKRLHGGSVKMTGETLPPVLIANGCLEIGTELGSKDLLVCCENASVAFVIKYGNANVRYIT